MAREFPPQARNLILAILLGAGSGVIASALTVGYLFTYVTEINTLMAPFRLSTERSRESLSMAEELARIRRVAMPSAVAVLPAAPAGRVRDLSEAIAYGAVLTSDGWLLVGADGKLAPSSQIAIGRDLYAIQRIEPAGVEGFQFVQVSARNLTVAPFGKGAGLLAGDRVMALAGPEALRPAVVESVRMVKAESSDQPARRLVLSLPSGNAHHGMPLVNAAGELVGIVASEENGHLHAVVFETFAPSLRSLLRSGTVSRPSLGLQGHHLAFTIGEPTDRNITNGFVVTNRRAGITEGDIILSINGEPIQRQRTLDEALASFSPGDEVRVERDRVGDRQTITIKLGTLP